MTTPNPVATLHKLDATQRGWVETCNICDVDAELDLVALCEGHASRFQADNPDAIQAPEPTEDPAPDPDTTVDDPDMPPLDVDMGLHYARLAVQKAIQAGDGTQFTVVADGLLFAAQALRNLEQLGLQLTQWADKQPDRLVRRVARPDVPGKVAGFTEEGDLVLFVPGTKAESNGATP